MTISENQASYNEKMVQQSKKKADKKCSQFKVRDVISIKINKVNNMTPFTPNMLIGKITEIENHYAQVLTRFGKIQITYLSYKMKSLHCYQSHFRLFKRSFLYISL